MTTYEKAKAIVENGGCMAHGVCCSATDKDTDGDCPCKIFCEYIPSVLIKAIAERYVDNHNAGIGKEG